MMTWVLLISFTVDRSDYQKMHRPSGRFRYIIPREKECIKVTIQRIVSYRRHPTAVVINIYLTLAVTEHALSMQLNDTGSVSRKVVLKHCKRQVACVSQTDALPIPIHQPIVIKTGMSHSSAASEISEPCFLFLPSSLTPLGTRTASPPSASHAKHGFISSLQLPKWEPLRPKRRPKNWKPGSLDQITLPNAADIVP